MANPTLQNAMIVNDETIESTGQLAPGDEAVDGDNNPVITVVRTNRAPNAEDLRPQGQLWVSTTTGLLYWSAGAGVWYQIRDTASLPAHETTHLPEGVDALPWGQIHGSGPIASRPAAAPTNAGFLYDSTDEKTLYRSNGVTWVEVSISAGSREYIHTQSAPATGWVVNHNLGRYPSAIQVRDSGGNVILAPAQHITINQLVVSFGRASSGTCTVR